MNGILQVSWSTLDIVTSHDIMSYLITAHYVRPNTALHYIIPHITASHYITPHHTTQCHTLNHVRPDQTRPCVRWALHFYLTYRSWHEWHWAGRGWDEQFASPSCPSSLLLFLLVILPPFPFTSYHLPTVSCVIWSHAAPYTTAASLLYLPLFLPSRLCVFFFSHFHFFFVPHHFHIFFLIEFSIHHFFHFCQLT